MEITQKEQDAWHAGIDAGREIERQNATASAEPVAVVVRDENDRPHAVLLEAGVNLQHGTGLYATPVSAEPDDQMCRQAYDDFYHKIRAEIGYDHWCAIWRFIVKRLAAPVAAQAQPAMPPLTDAMRAVIRNEHDVYGDEAALYAALCAAAQAQPLPDSLVPTAPDLEYLRSLADSTNLPAFLRGQIAAAVKALAAQGQNTDVPKPVAFAKDGVLFWYGDYSTWRGFNGELYLSAPPQRDADKADADPIRALLAERDKFFFALQEISHPEAVRGDATKIARYALAQEQGGKE